jgi:hypothetical protein
MHLDFEATKDEWGLSLVDISINCLDLKLMAQLCVIYKKQSNKINSR